MDAEHLDHYGNLEKHQERVRQLRKPRSVFTAPASLVPRPSQRSGDLCRRWPNGSSPTEWLRKRITARANVRHNELNSTYIAWPPAPKSSARSPFRCRGSYNVLNSLAVLSVCDYLDVPFQKRRADASLASFAGIQRRIHHSRSRSVASPSSMTFGHHHRPKFASRSRELALGSPVGGSSRHSNHTATPARAISFRSSRVLSTTPTKSSSATSSRPARKPIEGASSESLVKAIRDNGPPRMSPTSRPEPTWQNTWHRFSRPGDIVITLGRRRHSILVQRADHRARSEGGAKVAVKNLVTV